jgi:hypothetical protein
MESLNRVSPHSVAWSTAQFFCALGDASPAAAKRPLQGKGLAERRESARNDNLSPLLRFVLRRISGEEKGGIFDTTLVKDDRTKTATTPQTKQDLVWRGWLSSRKANVVQRKGKRKQETIRFTRSKSQCHDQGEEQKKKEERRKSDDCHDCDFPTRFTQKHTGQVRPRACRQPAAPACLALHTGPAPFLAILPRQATRPICDWP